MARFLPSADRRQTTDHRPAFSPLQDLRLFVSEEASGMPPFFGHLVC